METSRVTLIVSVLKHCSSFTYCFYIIYANINKVGEKQIMSHVRKQFELMDPLKVLETTKGSIHTLITADEIALVA